MSTMATTRGRFEVNVLKEAAAGRWPEILAAVAGIGAELLDGRHHACPKCGGKDRFRLIDKETGACFCNKCLDKKNGDGLAVIQHFLSALNAVNYWVQQQRLKQEFL